MEVQPDLDDAASQLVYDTLILASSQQPEILKPAEQKLKEWETQPGFYTTLFNVILKKDLNVHARWLSTVYFKNGIEKYWRHNAPNGISEKEKENLRVCLMKCFDEPVNQIASQMAVIISKVARLDCPREWPDLIDIFLANMKSENITIRHRALLYLHYTIKVLSTKRLIGDRKTFFVLSSNIYPFMLEYWIESISTVLSSISGAYKDEHLRNRFLMATLSSKILGKLTKSGFAKPHESVYVNRYIMLIFEKIRLLLQYRESLADDYIDYLEKLVTVLVKVLSALLEYHPLSYLNYIIPTLELGYYYAFTPEGYHLIFHEVLIHWLNLMKMILTCMEYRKQSTANSNNKVCLEMGDVDRAVEEANRCKAEFFTEPIVIEICEKLIGEYFLLTEADLKSWDDDPESYAADEVGKCWRVRLRPCTESLFMAMMHEFRDIIIPLVARIVENNRSRVDSNNMAAVLKKDAVYTSFGLAVFDLFDEINFDNWFTEVLIPELHDKNPNNRIIRRKVTWLLSQWSGIKLSVDLRPLLYSELVKLLAPEEDLVVRLTASNTIRQIIDDFEFKSDIFAEHIPLYFHSLFLLLEQVEECETKMQVLNVLTFIVERVGWSTTPYFKDLLCYLPLLWDQSSDHNMLRCSIVCTLTQIIKCLGVECHTMYEFIHAVIKYSLGKDSDGHIYLLEDGLTLLHAYVANLKSHSDDPQILDLYKFVIPHLENTTETMNAVSTITENYILLCPDAFLQMYGKELVEAFTDIYKDLKSEGLVLILLTYEMCLKVRPLESIQLLQKPLQQIFINLCQHTETASVISLSLSILSRVILISPDYFAQIIFSISNETNMSCNELFSNFLDYWLKKLSAVSISHRRKIIGLALMTLLASNSELVLNKFNEIMIGVVEILNDIVINDSTNAYVDMLIIDIDRKSPYEETEERSQHDLRNKEIEYSDVVYSVDLIQFVYSKMEMMHRQLGTATLQNLLNTLPNETSELLETYCSLSNIMK